jgi:Protein of unknown function (DUF3105)
MAQRKTSGATPKKPGNRPASGGPGARTGSPAGSPAGSAGKPKPGATGRPPAQKAAAGRPPTRKPNRSIVNQKQRPWGLIITAVVLVVFAAGIVVFAVTRNSGSSSGPSTSALKDPANKLYVQPELPAAKAIKGVTYKPEPNHTHVTGTVKYDSSPPTGGNHSGFWANCTGTVYTKQIANENAVHMLEHGAVWITYNPKTATAADISKLKSMVQGVDRTALSPYVNLKTPISLQAWNYQLFVQKATDPRIPKFIDALRYNPKTTPEPNASCSDPGFQADKSTPGHPFEG